LLFRCFVKFICIFKLFPELTTSVRAAYAGRTQPFAAMGADVVKSSAVLLSTFVLG
jgi:hypothetical protein